MPRRVAQTGPDKTAGNIENLRVNYEGSAFLCGKNKMDNPIFKRFDVFGNLQGWTLDNPPDERGYGVYVKGPNHATLTRQDTMLFDAPYYTQNQPLIDGAAPPDAAHVSGVQPFILPPEIELVQAEKIGFSEGWWALTYAYGTGEVGSGQLTPAAPILPLFIGQGQGVRIPLGGTSPEGSTYISFAMAGPFTTELAALGAPQVYEQKAVPTKPRLPAVLDLVGPYEHTKPISFHENTTSVADLAPPGAPETLVPIDDPLAPVPSPGGSVPKVNVPVPVPITQVVKRSKPGRGSRPNNSKHNQRRGRR